MAIWTRIFLPLLSARGLEVLEPLVWHRCPNFLGAAIRIQITFWFVLKTCFLHWTVSPPHFETRTYLFAANFKFFSSMKMLKEFYCLKRRAMFENKSASKSLISGPTDDRAYTVYFKLLFGNTSREAKLHFRTKRECKFDLNNTTVRKTSNISGERSCLTLHISPWARDLEKAVTINDLIK